MSRPEKEILERLGAEGLHRVLGDLLDQARLVRLANACGLKYPGMRTRSQAREKILADLVKRAGELQTTRRAIVRTLQKETRAAAKEWAALDPRERGRLLSDDDFLRSDGQLGRHLFLLASSDSEEDRGNLQGLLEREKRLGVPASPPRSAGPARKPTREESRLERRFTEIKKKVAHLEAQVTKSREMERAAKRDLIERKGELAESRMLVERLRKELEQARESAAASVKTKPTAPDAPSVDSLARAVRRLAGEQNKLVRLLEKQPEPGPEPAGAFDEALGPLADSINELKREIAAGKRERKKEMNPLAKGLEDLRSRLEELRGAPSAASPRARGKPGTERVGVFIDVQNIYYGARRLKGKLDFDALLEAAVRDRRLIEATAYVVESKEIDQSGFIAILQKRAIRVRRKTVRVRADGSRKGDWDMELALDILDAAPGLDVVVLVSGDGDFTSLVQKVKRMGPRVELIAFARTTAKSLLEAADAFEPLNRRFMIDANGSASRSRRAKPAAKKAVPEAEEPEKAG